MLGWVGRYRCQSSSYREEQYNGNRSSDGDLVHGDLPKFANLRDTVLRASRSERCDSRHTRHRIRHLCDGYHILFEWPGGKPCKSDAIFRSRGSTGKAVAEAGISASAALIRAVTSSMFFD
jgi:hypothetical protein